MEAALSLGMSRNLAIKRIVLPQALRISLPGITNDFIALFKDSSLVSIIAMVELTKTYNILASSTLRYFELGLITAILYFGMSYPLSLLARRLENRLRNGKNITSNIHFGNGFIATAKHNIKNKNHEIISLFLKGKKGGI
ncbi:MAG TPA: ABC transporter permease subunit, partial [Bacteroidales bacterium]|nr:ABC transporter permease subunit [Bacteroidales bacterium]